MYANDLTTIPANLAGVPGLALPMGLDPDNGLPVGIQLMAPARADQRLFQVGAALEALLDNRHGAVWEKIPDMAQGGGA
jgi:aspartyl-tRNA(Asn)/glutamyl-tRNA(Gln) amidotransferase subunit A